MTAFSEPLGDDALRSTVHTTGPVPVADVQVRARVVRTGRSALGRPPRKLR